MPSAHCARHSVAALMAAASGAKNLKIKHGVGEAGTYPERTKYAEEGASRKNEENCERDTYCWCFSDFIGLVTSYDFI